MIETILDVDVLRTSLGVLKPSEFEKFLKEEYGAERVIYSSQDLDRFVDFEGSVSVTSNLTFNLSKEGVTVVYRTSNSFIKTGSNIYGRIRIVAAGDEEAIAALRIRLEEELCYNEPEFYGK